jgi:phospholipid transport system substrate-binding protein
MVRLIPIALALVSLSFHEAWGTTPTAELQAFFADATLILTDPETDGKHAERLGAIRAITRQIFDIREAAKLSLGPAWRDRSEAEREEFTHLYGDFLERAFIAWIAARAQIDGGPRVSYLGESVGAGQATVRTTVLGRNGRDLPLEYRMVERGDRWAVRDVVIDGVSLAANYRAQFTRVIQSSSYPELVQQLRDKVAPPPPAAVIASAAPLAPEPETALPPQESAAQERPAAALPPVAETTRNTNGTLRMDAPRGRPNGASRGPMTPNKPALVMPPAKNRIEPGGPRTTTSAFPATGISRHRSYWVQVGAFKSVEAAIRLASHLRGEKSVAPDRWAVVMEPGPSPARVRVGPFADRAEATSNLRELTSRGFKPFIAEESRNPR